MRHIETKSKAVLYCRYSSHAQRDVSIDQQVKACTDYADRARIAIVRIFADRAYSGTTDQRPEFQRMIAEAPELGVQYVLVYALDRFARDRYDSAIYKHRLKEAGIRVISATEPITDDPMGVLMEAMLEGWAEYYSKELSRKIVRGMEDNASRCMVTGSIPYGYRKGPDGRYEIDPEQAAVVREIYGRVLSGEPLAAISADLNSRGLTTKSGARWNKSSFNTILSNERYTGVYIYRDVRIPGGIPQIIDRETFEAVQDALQTKKRPRRGDSPIRRRRENGVYMLTGKLYCGLCGSPMVGISGKSTAEKINYYYTCKSRRQKTGCTAPMLRRERVEREIAQAIRTQLTPERMDLLARATLQAQEEETASSDLSLLQERLREVERGIANIIRAIEKGVDSDDLAHRLNELKAQRKDLQARIAEAAQFRTITYDEVIALLHLYAEGDPDDALYQEGLFNAFLLRAYVTGTRLDIMISILGDNVEISASLDELTEISDCIKPFGGGEGS